ncbi:MAG: hypothetical protein LC789_04965 [Actinobacteria bacterium]|nr:hypothetical protein [Actinomycetota bacterium]MCA1722499.1 hypothetical protein [Actinomycetota bacterium]
MTDEPTDELFERLSAQLVEAHRRVRSLDVPKDEKARATRRLLAISDASKHDLQRAAARLETFLEDLDHGRTAAGDPSDR